MNFQIIDKEVVVKKPHSVSITMTLTEAESLKHLLGNLSLTAPPPWWDMEIIRKHAIAEKVVNDICHGIDSSYDGCIWGTTKMVLKGV